MKGNLQYPSDPVSIQIRSAFDQYIRKSLSSLQEEYLLSHKVCDLRGVRKGDLIADLLDDQFGAKRVKAAFEMHPGKAE